MHQQQQQQHILPATGSPVKQYAGGGALLENNGSLLGHRGATATQAGSLGNSNHHNNIGWTSPGTPNRQPMGLGGAPSAHQKNYPMPPPVPLMHQPMSGNGCAGLDRLGTLEESKSPPSNCASMVSMVSLNNNNNNNNSSEQLGSAMGVSMDGSSAGRTGSESSETSSSEATSTDEDGWESGE